MRRRSEPKEDDNEDKRWRTMIMGGLRNGGSSYYALDVTYPTASVTDTIPANEPYPAYMWGFPCDGCASSLNPGTATEKPYMGYTWSEPVITRVRVKSESGANPDGYDRWVAVFGAGYHPHGDPNGSDYRQLGDAGFTPKGRAIYMVDVTTGEVLAKIAMIRWAVIPNTRNWSCPEWARSPTSPHFSPRSVARRGHITRRSRWVVRDAAKWKVG